MTGRFAPTPSGRMHMGNAYAMLAAWLSARARHEPILLRIEDIDAPRALPDADRWIMDDLTWLGLDWDGEPVYQSQRLDLYEGVFRLLRDADPSPLYPCFCSRAEIRAASAPQEGDRFIIYPGTCRRLLAHDPHEVRRRRDAGVRHSWRFAVPPAGTPQSQILFEDRVFGAQNFDLGAELGDVVLRRSDGLFSYQLVVTVDDLLMGVTDIVRGRDLLRSTALQEHVRALLLDMGLADRNRPAARPAYAHLPLLDDAAGVRLAKREHAPDLGALRAQGVRPEQIIGYCAWALGLTDHPQAMEAADALALFSWDAVRSHVEATDARSDVDEIDGAGGRVGDDDRSDGRADVRVPDDLPSLLLRL